MNSNLFKLLPVAAAAALLAACGGGSSPVDVSAPVVPWASPAMIVPASESSTTLAFTNCISRPDNTNYPTATLVVNSAGDMVFSGTPAGSTSAVELQRVNFADSTLSKVEGSNSASGQSLAVESSNSGIGMGIRAYLTNDRSNLTVSRLSPQRTISCNNPASALLATLSVLPSSARLASEMLSGVTSLNSDDLRSPASLTGGVAYWDNLNPDSQPPAADSPMAAHRYMSLNLSTGALGTSNTPNTLGNSTIIRLPAPPSTQYGFFREARSGAAKEFFAGIPAATPSNYTIRLCLLKLAESPTELKIYPDGYCD